MKGDTPVGAEEIPLEIRCSTKEIVNEGYDQSVFQGPVLRYCRHVCPPVFYEDDKDCLKSLSAVMPSPTAGSSAVFTLFRYALGITNDSALSARPGDDAHHHLNDEQAYLSSSSFSATDPSNGIARGHDSL